MGVLFVVGIGPGSTEYLTEQARAALEAAEVICGYTAYIDLIQPVYPEKEYFSTPMMQEIERCRAALELARQGRTTAMICSGDAGVYGMAAPILELAPEYPEAEIEIVPGVTAALSGGAILGAPLGHDFCVISLSDLLTPWAIIETRLKAAAMGNFAICLYNPSSKKRADYLKRACLILMRSGKSPAACCGIVRNIGRAGEEKRIMTLRELADYPADMFTTVFIGSSSTYEKNGKMITPRGYKR